MSAIWKRFVYNKYSDFGDFFLRSFLILVICFFVPSQHYVPFIYVLMSGKKQICYEHLIAYIHEHVLDLECASFTTDYEHAMRNSLAKRYPDAVHRCCWFHFTQAVKRNASQICDFVKTIRKNLVERELYYKIMCLPLLPVHLIRPTFDLLQERGRKLSTYSSFIDFLSYIERQWMEKVCELRL